MRLMIYIFLFISLLNISCKEKHSNKEKQEIITEINEVNNTNNNEMSTIEKQLSKQLQAGYLLKEVGLDGESNYEYTSKDYEAINIISKEILKKGGYGFKDVESKVLSIFKIESNEGYKTILVEGYCNEKPLYQLDFEGILSANSPIQIDFKNHFLLETLFIPELVDYQNKFPDIAKIESSIKTDFDGYKLILWKDAPELNLRRKFNEQILINRNFYLFNDDKSRLPWLLKNDEYFMKSLVLTFGWEGDDKLLKWVIKETPLKLNAYDNNAKEFGKLIYNKDCSG
ncbi:MAG: hypothetical protein ACK5IC_03285, partial [Moheibacter sp.]